MAVGIKRLQRIQWVKEVTPGTPVATATTRWRGAGAMLDDQRKIEEIEEWMGIIDGADRTAVVQLLGMLELAETPLTADQLQYLMVMGMGGPTARAQARSAISSARSPMRSRSVVIIITDTIRRKSVATG